MADLIAEGLHEGFWDLTVAAIPETCGHAMEVPESKLKSGGSFPAGASAVSLPIHAARMFTPGAAISGCQKHQVRYTSQPPCFKGENTKERLRASVLGSANNSILEQNGRWMDNEIKETFALRRFFVAYEGPLDEK